MKYTLIENLTQIELSRIIERGWELEARRDVDGAIENFAPLWPNIASEPDFSRFEPSQAAELYRLSGFFLSIYGNVRRLRDYQERAKNLLSKSIEIFTQLSDWYAVADAQNVLAVCYLNEGAILEAETILHQTADQFLGNHLHPAYLRNRNNLLQTTINRKNYQASIEIIEEMRVPMEFCEDYRVCCLFHEKAGIVYRGLRQYEKAIGHYNEAIRYAAALKNFLFISSQKNNLAFLYNKIHNFEAAHENINEAISLAVEHRFTGWLPNFLDTQALIFANQGNYAVALEKIERVIELLSDGDDFYNLAEATWNKCKFLLRLDRKEQAIALFSELILLAGQRMGEFAVKQFTQEFADLIHVKREDLSLTDELKRFKRNEVAEAVRRADYNLSAAAELLRIEAAELIRILDKEFPDLYGELDLQHSKLFQGQTSPLETPPKSSVPRNISPLSLHGVEISVPDSAAEKILTFYVAAEKVPASFCVDDDAVVAVTVDVETAAGDFLLIIDPAQKIYKLGRVQFEATLQLSYISDDTGEMPVFLNDVEVVGRVIGYCPFAELDQNKLVFSPLS